MKKLFITLCVLSVFNVGSLSAMPQHPECENCPPPRQGNCMKHPDSQKLYEQLNLTEAQKTQARQNKLAAHEKIKPLMDELMAKREQIFQIKNSELSNAEKDKQIEEIKKEMKPVKLKIDEIRKENFKKFEALLTPEQKAKFEKIKAEHRKKLAEQGHKMPPRPLDK